MPPQNLSMELKMTPHLPNEVLIKILSHLPDSRDLALVALVSRNFDALVQGLLYRSLNLTVGCTEEGSLSSHSSSDELHMFKRSSRLIDKLSTKSEFGYVYFQISHCQR